jgi:hypothetical protein
MIKVLVQSVPDEIPDGTRYEVAAGLPGDMTGWFQISHAGLVLATGEHNYHDDSDFYATVWDGQGPREITYASTRGWTYANSATADATPEVQAAYGAWRQARAGERQAAATAAEAATPRAGKTVRVVRGRKVPVGTVAEVVWYGEGKRFSRHAPVPMRVGLLTGDERVFTDAANVEVVTADEPGHPMRRHL